MKRNNLRTLCGVMAKRETLRTLRLELKTIFILNVFDGQFILQTRCQWPGNMEVIELTTERITGCVDFFMKREKGGDLELPF